MKVSHWPYLDGGKQQAHDAPAFTFTNQKGASFVSRTDGFVASEISIPLFPSITQKQQKYVADTLKHILASI